MLEMKITYSRLFYTGVQETGVSNERKKYLENVTINVNHKQFHIVKNFPIIYLRYENLHHHLYHHHHYHSLIINLLTYIGIEL